MSKAHRPCSIPGHGGGQKQGRCAAQLRFCPQIQRHGPQVPLPQPSAGPAHAVHFSFEHGRQRHPHEAGRWSRSHGSCWQEGFTSACLPGGGDQGTTDLQLAWDRHVVLLPIQAVRRVALTELPGAGTGQAHRPSFQLSAFTCCCRPCKSKQDLAGAPTSFFLGSWPMGSA